MPNESPRFPVENSGEEKLACAVVVDTSGSMEEYEKELNEAISEMKAAIEEDDMARGRVDLCLIAYDDDVRVVNEFGSVKYFNPQYLDCGGMTSTHAAIDVALARAEERKEMYKSAGCIYKQPWIWLFTDGKSTDTDNGSFQRLLQAQRDKKCVFFAVGIGDKINRDELKAMHKDGLLLRVDKEEFKAAFQYLSQSVKGASKKNMADGGSFDMPTVPQQIHVDLY